MEPVLGFEEIGHTADLSIRAWGSTLDELFVAAARGMFSLIGEAGPPISARTLELDAPDSEALLVDWLNELLYLSDRHEESYSGYDLRIDGGRCLSAEVRGGPLKRREARIKAATYHGLAIERENDSYTASVIFDT